MTLGERLRELRKKHRLNQEDVAQFVSLSRPLVTAWEGDQLEPSLRTLSKIAELYRMTLSTLIESVEFEPDEIAEPPVLPFDD